MGWIIRDGVWDWTQTGPYSEMIDFNSGFNAGKRIGGDVSAGALASALYGLGMSDDMLIIEAPPSESIMPWDMWSLGDAVYRSGYDALNNEGHTEAKLEPGLGRLIFQRRNGQILASVGMAMASGNMVKWLHGMTSLYAKNLVVKFLTRGAPDHMGFVHQATEHTLDELRTGEHEQLEYSDAFDYTSPRDWFWFAADTAFWLFEPTGKRK